ncbi:hypothetical protein KCP78_16555 [Salmonella enterica subsp. enterica]|nr:hypothetical protein KCP78_16555 [Salmonella enterica subsp. enterica]
MTSLFSGQTAFAHLTVLGFWPRCTGVNVGTGFVMGACYLISSAVPHLAARSVDEYCRLPRRLKFQLFNLGGLAAGYWCNVAFTGRGHYCFLGRVFSDQRLFQTGSVLE